MFYCILGIVLIIISLYSMIKAEDKFMVFVFLALALIGLLIFSYGGR